MVRISLDQLFDESSHGRRTLILVLYAVITPVYCGIMAIQLGAAWVLPVSLVVCLCVLGVLSVALPKKLGRYHWVYPAAFGPVVCCGIAAYSVQDQGLVYLAVMTAPLAWAAVLFELPTVITAWATSTTVCMVVLWRAADPAAAILGTLGFGLVEGLVGWVVYSKSVGLRGARLESLDRHLNDVELTLNLDGDILQVNDRAVQTYGYTLKEFQSLSIWDLMPDFQSEAYRGHFAQVKQGQNMVFEAFHRCRDRTTFPVEVSSRLFRYRGRDYVHSLVRDISARKAEEWKLKRLFEEVSRQNTLKERLFTILAHDLRGPVGMVAKSLDPAFLKNNFTPEQLLDDVLPGLKNWSDSAYQLLEGLLEWIQGSMDGMKRKPVTLTVAEVVEPVFQWQQAQAASKDVRLVLAAGQEICFEADLVMTQTILRNLVSNAVKFSSPGAEVRVVAETVGADAVGRDGWVALRVVDQGAGIPESMLAVLFTLSPEKVRAGTGGEKGSGLGLMFSRDMAEAMGARLEVESRLGKGSTFTLEFPPPLSL